MLKFQPSNSPITNVKDDCIFPAISKHVSREQGILKGSQVFSTDELWQSVEKCWNAFPLNTISRAYVRHSQIASALISCSGGDEFVRERGGLHHNVRHCCVTVCDRDGVPTGVEVVTIPDNEDDNQPRRQLKYPVPDVSAGLSETLKKMTTSEISTIFEGLPVSHAWLTTVAMESISRERDKTAG